MGYNEEEHLQAKKNSFDEVKIYFGKSNELYQTTTSEIFKALKEIETTAEKIQLLKDNIKFLTELLIEHKEKVITHVSLEDQFNSIDTPKEAITQSILFCKDLLMDFEVIGETGIKQMEKKDKLKWRGTPSQFGYLFLQLAKKGFIEIPSTSGEASYS